MEWRHVTSSRIPKEEETQECAMSLKSHRYWVLGWDVSFLWTSCPGTELNSDNCCIEMQRNLIIHVHPTRKVKCCCYITMLGTHMCSPRRLLQILDGQYCSIHCTVMTSQLQSITCLVLWRKACEDVIMPKVRHCRMLCQWLQEWQQLLPVGNTCACSKVAEDCWQRWRLHWKVSTPLSS